ncbi:MAG: type II toxin-antitoxin system VapC family toxin [Nitrospinae bacterium]|nr:type II toxin-antitoxin system VapC family toxin [Nitrospinota bacterium]
MSARKAAVDTSVIIRLLTGDDERKRRTAEALFKDAAAGSLTLYLPPVTILETVWVLEKAYRAPRAKVAQIVEALINSPGVRVERAPAWRAALRDYALRNVKFADAALAHWALEEGLDAVYTFDEKDFKRIEGIKPLIP